MHLGNERVKRGQRELKKRSALEDFCRSHSNTDFWDDYTGRILGFQENLISMGIDARRIETGRPKKRRIETQLY
jgi:hypothetical protein